MKEIVIDFKGVKSVWYFHEALIEPLGLEIPECSGMEAGYKYAKNFDALWDILDGTYEEETVIILRNIDNLRKKLPETVADAKELFNDLQKKHKNVKIVYE